MARRPAASKPQRGAGRRQACFVGAEIFRLEVAHDAGLVARTDGNLASFFPKSKPGARGVRKARSAEDKGNAARRRC